MSHNDEPRDMQRESLLLRIVWMVIFVMVWQLGAWVLGAAVLLQLIYRLIKGEPQANLTRFGDSLSQYLGQIGRFGMFATEQKPWPFSAWPLAEAEAVAAASVPAEAVAPAAAEQEPKL